jgi:tripartite-type tricarboxylate transporter receptor subunit TctC
MGRKVLSSLLVALGVCGSTIVEAQPSKNFYEGKQIRLLVASEPGGGYDAYARLIAAHITRHISGSPTIIVSGMPGAGSLVVVNHMANVAPKDGTVLVAMHSAGALAPLLHPDQAKFDSRKLNWIGSPVTVTYTLIVSKDAPIKSFDEAFNKEIVIAASAGSDSATLPLMTNSFVGTKFKVIQGYKGSSDTMLAVIRGEAQGRVITLSSLRSVNAPYIDSGRVRIIATYGLRPDPQLEGIPRVVDFAKTEEGRKAIELALTADEVGWPYVMAPGVPDDRVKIMRTAFNETMKDEEFLADAKKRKLEITPISWQDQVRRVQEAFAAPSNIVDQVKKAIEP